MRVLVFGAGASRGYGMPLNKDLLPRAFERHAFGCSSSRDEEFELVAKTIDHLYGTQLEQSMSGWVEQQGVFRRVSQDPESMYLLNKINIEDLVLHAQRQQDGRLQEALASLLFRSLTDDYGGECGEYERLVRRLAEFPQETCLISFNYDLALDRALAQRGLRFSYGMNFDAGIENFPSHEADSQLHLLKLHGSLNWHRCTHCEKVLLSFSWQWGPGRVFRCRSCSDVKRFAPFLVAPSSEKDFPSLFEGPWRIAACALSRATELIIVGYSFPTVDKEARNLFLKHFIVKNLYGPTCRRLAIADPSRPLRRALIEWLGPLRDGRGAKITAQEFENFEKLCRTMGT